MLSRMMNNHSKVLSLPELHFFERYDAEQKVDIGKKLEAAVYLLRIIQNGFFDATSGNEFLVEANDIIDKYKPDTNGMVYRAVLEHIMIKSNSEIICEQTPQNIFYKKQIESILPATFFVHIVRDPRDVLLSQKRKWRRASQGAVFIPWKETIRAYFNYHPYTISKIWNAVVSNAWNNHLFTVRYEDLVSSPVNTLKEICNACNIDFEVNMEQVPLTGSSSSKDSNEQGLNSSRIGAWQKGGLNTAEVFICQNVNDQVAHKFGYSSIKLFPNIFLLLFYLLYLPFQLLIAILLNLGRQRNIISAIKRRIN